MYIFINEYLINFVYLRVVQPEKMEIKNLYLYHNYCFVVYLVFTNF